MPTASRDKHDRLDTQRGGFTLIELLVVVTIIVVLLGLLTPALDRALYRAELVLCAAGLHQVGGGTIQYAHENRHRYFHRAAVHETGIGSFEPRMLSVPFRNGQTKNINGYDDRPIMRPYISIDSLMCPLSGEVSMDEPSSNTTIFAAYSLWVGWKYDLDGQDPNNPRASKGMLKTGDSLEWDGNSYNVLAGDTCVSIWSGLGSSHPDSLGIAHEESLQGDSDGTGGGVNPDSTTFAEWRCNVFDFPGTFDMNFLWDDGSARRIDQMKWDPRTHDPFWGGDTEPRTETLPPWKDARWDNFGVLTIPRGH